MEIKVCISVQASHEKYHRYVRETIREDDLLEWAKRYISERYSEGNKVVGIEVESIVP